MSLEESFARFQLVAFSSILIVSSENVETGVLPPKEDRLQFFKAAGWRLERLQSLNPAGLDQIGLDCLPGGLDWMGLLRKCVLTRSRLGEVGRYLCVYL